MDKEMLFQYRWTCALETIDDADKLMSAGASARSIVNRAYYAMFYAILALFIKKDIKIVTTKHSGVISLFDQNFIKTGLIDKQFSQIFHRAFNDRQEFDYKDYSIVESSDAVEILENARQFIDTIKSIILTK
jgi:uncharacterized protein (UPF0332 family)